MNDAKKGGPTPSSKIFVWCIVLVVCLLPVSNAQATPLFDGPPSASHVAQGQYGTCYIHAVAAAMAQSQPHTLQSRMTETSLAGVQVVAVQVAHGQTEYMLKSDLQDMVSGNTDFSRGGLWVAAILRAYGQSKLRTAMVQSFEETARGSSLPGVGMLTDGVRTLAENDPLFVSALYSSVRLSIDAEGKLDRRRFKQRLKSTLSQLPGVGSVASKAADLVCSGPFMDAAEGVISTYGESFLKPSSIGAGGNPGRVAEKIFGMNCRRSSGTSLLNFSAVQNSLNSGGIAIIATGSRCNGAQASWFTDNHAFAVLGASNTQMRVRNPWRSTPQPFSLGVNEYRRCIETLWLCR